MSFIVDVISKSAGGKTQGRRIGEYWVYDEALAAAKRVIDNFLYHEYIESAGHGITAEKLLNQYLRKGGVTLILHNTERSTSVPSFNHCKYAAKRCVELCGRKKKK